MKDKNTVMAEIDQARRSRRWLLVLVVFILPVIVTGVSLCAGRYFISADKVIRLLLSLVGGSTEGISNVEKNVFFNIRLPRVIFSLLAGGALGMAGCVLQGVFRNPLVSDDIMGVSSGATLGAAISIIFLGGGELTTEVLAFTCGILTMILIFRLSLVRNSQNVLSIILAGVIINSLMKSAISMIKYVADPYSQIVSLDYWLMGSLNTTTWTKLGMFLPFFLAGSLVLFLLRWQVNLLSLGDEEAASLGVKVRFVRGCLVTASTVMVASVVAVTGIISWIGLIAPHVIRLIMGNDHAKAIPLSFMAGAMLMAVADVLARSLVTVELPLSAVISVLGAPMLAYLLWKAGSNKW